MWSYIDIDVYIFHSKKYIDIDEQEIFFDGVVLESSICHVQSLTIGVMF